MSIGAFTDKNTRPTETEIAKTVGKMLSLWKKVAAFIRSNYTVQEDLKFLYGKKYGWALRFQLKKKLLTSLYPAEGGFTVQVNLNPAAVEKAQWIKPGKNVQRAIADANPYPEGRWLFVHIESEKDIEDVERLLELRSESLDSKSRGQ